MTMQGWDLESNNNNGTSGTEKQEFTKFPEGITRIRVVTEQPHIRWVHWMQKHKRSINCPGRGCPICEIRRQQKANKEDYTYNMTKRFAVQVLNRETGRLEIMEQGVTFFQDLKDVLTDFIHDEAEKGQDVSLFDLDVKVRRRGTGKDNTSYRIDPDESYPLSDQDKELLNARIDLADYFKPHSNEQILDLLNGKEWDEVMKQETTSINQSSDENEEGEEIVIR